MGQEKPEQKREPTDQEWAKLARLAKKWHEVCLAEVESGSSESMRHIMGGLVSSALQPGFYNNPDRRRVLGAMLIEMVPRVVTQLRRYVKLLKDYPEFKEYEKSGGGGYFKDLGIKLNYKNWGKTEYIIDAYEEKLREIFPKKKLARKNPRSS